LCVKKCNFVYFTYILQSPLREEFTPYFLHEGSS
jgi:hypothetical protein